MATKTVSASVDTRTKVIANNYIRKAGLTPNQVIRSLWENIAETGKIPEFEGKENGHQNERHEAYLKAQRVVSHIPQGTPLATMSDADLRKELENREV